MDPADAARPDLPDLADNAVSEVQDNEPVSTDISAAAARLTRFALASAIRYLPLILVTTVVCGGLGLYTVLLRPDVFESSGKLHIRPGVRQNLTAESAFADTTKGQVSTREIVLNELQLLSTPDIYQKAALRVGLDTVLAPAEPDPEDGWRAVLRGYALSLRSFLQGAPESEEEVTEQMRLSVASDILAKVAEIRPELGANVITIRYSSDTPEKAQQIVDALLDAAVEVHGETMDSMDSIGAIEREVEQAAVESRDAEGELRAFLSDRQIYDFENQQAMLVAYLDEITKALDASEVTKLRTQAEIEVLATLKEQIDPMRPATGQTSFVMNPNITALTNTLEQVRVRKFDLEVQRSSLGVEDYLKRLKLLDDLAADIQARINATDLQLQIPGAVEVNPDYTSIVADLRLREVTMKGLERERGRLEATKATTEKRLAEFAAMNPVKQGLELDATEKRATADRLSNTLNSMKALRRLEQLKMSNLQVMHRATFERDAVGPRRFSLFIASAVGGIALGTLLALIMGLRHGSVRDRHDLALIGADAAPILQDPPAVDASSGRWHDERLPAPLLAMQASIAEVFACVHYDPRSADALCLGVVPCDDHADASRAAAQLAAGLSILGGKKVVYVSCNRDSRWLAEVFGDSAPLGWADVVNGDRRLGDVLRRTAVGELEYLSMGGEALSEPSLAGSGLLNLIYELKQNRDFVVVELPSMLAKPEVPTTLRALDAVLLALSVKQTSRAAVRDARQRVQEAGAELIAISMQIGSSGQA